MFNSKHTLVHMAAEFNGVIEPHPDGVKVKQEPIDVDKLDEFGGVLGMDPIKPHRQPGVQFPEPPCCPVATTLEPVSLMDVLQVAGAAFVTGLAIGLSFTWAYSNRVVE